MSYTDILKRMQTERLRLVGEQRALIDTADAEKRELTGDENTGFEQRDAQIRAIDERVKDLRDREQRDQEAEEAFRSLLEQPERRDKKGPADVGGDVAARDFFAGRGGKSFEVRSGKPMGTAEFRTLSKLTAGAGANTVKVSFYDQLIAHMIDVSAILDAGPTVLTTTSGEQIQIPKTTAHGTASLIAEAGTITASDPTFGQVPLDAYKYALLVQLSSELLTDTSVDALGYVAMQAGRAVGNAFGAHAITGTGTNQPNGVATAATTGVTGGAGVAGAFTSDNLIDLFYSVIAPYRNSKSCGWLLRDVTMGAVRKLKDTTGQYLWQPSIQLGTPDTLLGKPVRTDPNVAAVALSAKSVLFGDVSQYFVRLVNGVRFERSDDFAFSSDLVTFRCILRADGDLVDTSGAIKAFVGNAA